MSTQTFRRLAKVLVPAVIVSAALLGSVLSGSAQNTSRQEGGSGAGALQTGAALSDGHEPSAQSAALRTQMVMMLDGSGSINAAEWSIIRNGLAEAVDNPECLPPDGSMQLTIIQFARQSALLQIGPLVIDSPATAAAAAEQIRIMRQLEWTTPIATGICLAANVLRYHPAAQFDPGLKQVLNLVTDGVPNVCGTCDACPTQGPSWRCDGLPRCPGECTDLVCPPAEQAAVAARNYALSLLEMDPAQDEFDVEGVGITEENKEWLRTEIAWPGSNEWLPPARPPGPGWIRVVADPQEFADTVCEKFKLASAGLDFGDAPDSSDPAVPPGYDFPTLLANNGARHAIGDIRMGTYVDAELDGQPIDQDDVLPPAAPDDEDGVVFLGAGPPGGPYALPYRAGQNGAVQITIRAIGTPVGTGYLHGWFDWNQDGDWNDLQEEAFSGYAIPLAAGVYTIDFPVPTSALEAPPGVTWARFRLDDQNLGTVDGWAGNGEVEDHNEAVVCPRFIIEVEPEPASGCEPLTVRFDATVSGGTPPYQYEWDLGDGSSSTLEHPVHTYEAGAYTVSVTVTDQYGCSATHSEPNLVRVYALPTARFTADPSSGFVPLTVQFTDTSIPADAPIAEWYWDFGDGATSAAQNPSHTYAEPGPYTVTLSVADAYGCRDTVAQPNQILAGELEIAKHRPHGVVCATHTFWYYICVTNTSDFPLEAINPVLTDVLPEGIAPYSVLVSEAGQFDGVDTVTWELDDLAPGEGACVWIRAQTFGSAAGAWITNRAWIDADNVQEPILVTEVAYVYREPCPPQSTATPPPTATPTPTAPPPSTPTATPGPAPTVTPTTGGILACLWSDLDGDGSQDPDEEGLASAPVDLWDHQGQWLDSCRTMSTDGCCTFGDLSPGWYTVGPGAMPGMFFTTARHADVEVFAGKVKRVSFGSRQLRILLLPVIIKNGA